MKSLGTRAASLLLSLFHVVSCATDLTRVEGLGGDTVVSATLARIHETCLFPNDYLFLRRLAHVVSDDGTNNNTYRAGFHGGLWQIREQDYDMTHNVVGVDYSGLETSLNVSWSQTNWTDLRKPLYSGIAAMLTLVRLSPIPRDSAAQSQFYQIHLAGQAQEFLDGIATLDIGCRSNNLDMAFVLDSSGSVDVADYEKSKTFTASIVEGFDVRPDSVRVAAIAFSKNIAHEFDLNTYNTAQDVKDAVMRIGKESAETRTDLALDFLRETIFTHQRGARNNSAKIAIVQTDGKSTEPALTGPAAQALRDEGIVVFVIGIGSGINETELHTIASSPTCTRVRLLADFTELTSILADIEQAACKTEVIQPVNTSSSYHCGGDNTVKLTAAAQLTISVRSESAGLRLSGSFEITQPNAAFNDFFSVVNNSRPTVMYVQNASQPLFVNIVSADPDCDSNYLMAVHGRNSLKKTGAHNLCYKDPQMLKCSDLDFVKSHDYITVDASTHSVASLVCVGGATGYKSHPDTPTKYLYCDAGGVAYVADCPSGFAYLESAEDCIAPASNDPEVMCDVCTKENVDLGLFCFPTLTSESLYVNCTDVSTCVLEQCPTSYVYVPDDQECALGRSSLSKQSVSWHLMLLSVCASFCFKATARPF
ncbi:uncharacterized protein LOC101847656 [Aplysia californica]|uniref:Uncharacterized protein LOC101847656 n=1 Tax=Aplysia californica TaxID=6500 RepID=A0ABM0JQG0_APLCA|nr:uncharacterized protein LOC101847656 [Aplysia californica]